ncbi:MAG: hypothetical protein K1Y36_27020 [Blastocatellia bacterium]|nr:hypothetical protein [Blastocatellia bacterium]
MASTLGPIRCLSPVIRDLSLLLTTADGRSSKASRLRRDSGGTWGKEIMGANLIG